jgi:hypothetical protein
MYAGIFDCRVEHRGVGGLDTGSWELSIGISWVFRLMTRVEFMVVLLKYIFSLPLLALLNALPSSVLTPP